jgi:hypothetical protein
VIRAVLLASTALAAAGLPRHASAADATWTGTTSSDYNASANWNPTGPPSGIATFNASASSFTPTITGTTSAGQWNFTAAGTNWVFGNQSTFDFTGSGITIGAGTVTINNQVGAVLNFNGTSTAAGATINISDPTGFTGSFVNFFNSSTAANATISVLNNSSFVAIHDQASGGSARFILTNDGGVANPGTLYISTVTTGGTTAGSIEGSGNVVLGANNLQVGSLNSSTELSGVISGTNGSLTKVGS